MKTFSYPIFAKIVYRYANIFITFVLLIHLVIFFIAPQKNWGYLPLGLINLILIYVVNRFYFTNYKYFPYDIKADDEKIIVSNFVINNRTETINFKDIEKLTGGVFNKKPSTPIYIIYNSGKKIGINTHLKEFNRLLTLILQHVSESVYKNTLDDMKIKADEQIASMKTKINKTKERKTNRKKK